MICAWLTRVFSASRSLREVRVECARLREANEKLRAAGCEAAVAEQAEVMVHKQNRWKIESKHVPGEGYCVEVIGPLGNTDVSHLTDFYPLRQEAIGASREFTRNYRPIRHGKLYNFDGRNYHVELHTR